MSTHVETDEQCASPCRILTTQVGDIAILLPIFDAIPNALKQLPFAVWEAEPDLDGQGNQKCKPNGRPRIKKAPRHSRGHLISKSKPEEWMASDNCLASFDPKQFHGVGVLLRASSGTVGIDLDDYDALIAEFPAIEKLMQQAKEAGVYCENSPSKTGLRLFVKGSLPEGKGRRQGGIEIYGDTAFLTVTGAARWPGDVVEGQWLVDALIGIIDDCPRESGAEKAHSRDEAATPADPIIVERLSAEMERQQPRLWRGQWQSDGGNLHPDYPSQSEADFALCGCVSRAASAVGVPRAALATTIAEVFRRSGLYRPDKEKTVRNHTIPNIVKRHFETETAAPADDWKELRPLPSPLPPAPTFDIELLPSALRGFVEDVAGRMQVPAEIVATPLLIALGSVIGKKLAIQPRSVDASWYEYPNLWGVSILQPGMLKSPALNEATKFIRELEDLAKRQHEATLMRWQADEALRKIVQKDREADVKKLFKEGKFDEARELAQQAQKAPVRRRYIIMDATPEARLRVLGENPNGVMLIRDELSGHIAQLHRDGYEQARAQELQFYDGKFNYEDDRLKREGMFASEPRMAVYGNLQPSKVEALLYDRSQTGKGLDDGYLERLFQLAVMPTLSPEYTLNKSQPDEDAEGRVRSIFKAADALQGELDVATGQLKPRKLHFDPNAEGQFDTVFQELERSLRKPGGREQSKSHRGKYRGTIVKLALVLAFCEDSQLPAIPIEALHRAVRLTSFYDRHAKRIYALGEPSDLASAHELLGHLKSGHLKDGFGARDVEMRKWKRLKTLGEIEGAIAVLCDHGHLLERRNKDTGGAPSRKLFINPAVEREVRGRAA
jgi:Protein of unknown function (DUF3987)